jgi:hypothetical protein
MLERYELSPNKKASPSNDVKLLSGVCYDDPDVPDYLTAAERKAAAQRIALYMGWQS